MNEIISEKIGNNTLNGETIDCNTIDGGSIDRKEFMRQVGIGFGAIMLMNCLQSCSNGSEIPDPNPISNTTKVDVTLDLNSTDYKELKNKGMYAIVRGQSIIVAHTNADTYLAVSSKCTHEGTQIIYRGVSNDFLCPNHGSEFKADGSVQKSPAAAPLKKYSYSLDVTNNKLRIFE
jgi:cytochrome b6-f complex iron-sulfur subunit